MYNSYYYKRFIITSKQDEKYRKDINHKPPTKQKRPRID
jgi:hypothetical protein